jgi:hypothetical protein
MRAARQRRAMERVIAGLNARGQMILAVDYYGVYGRIWVPCALGMMGLSPRTAARHLRAIETREFERAIAAR